MFKLIRQGFVFSPESKGILDILVCDQKIVQIEENLSQLGEQLGAVVIPAYEKIVIPGFIDQHLHFLGGGDYEGPAGATTDIEFSSLVKSGITTAISLLGCDDTARNLMDLMKRAIAFEKLGITTYIYTGSLNVPPPTLTGSVRRDVTTIEKIIGVKLAISEVLASLSPLMEMANIAKEAYFGAQYSGKKGLIHVHVGKGAERMEHLFELVKISGVPIGNFIPTHVNRLHPNVVEHAIKFAKMGGTVDMSAIMSPEAGSPTSIRADYALTEFLRQDVPLEHVTLSSDGNCPMPIFDDKGNKTGLYNFPVDHLFRTLLMIFQNCKIPFADALKLVTSNVARCVGIEDRKGSITVGKDADLILLSKQYEIETVLARGQLMVRDGKAVVRGYYEKD
jgi:beta-aspartyl-dipeptidase (metallo-type)